MIPKEKRDIAVWGVMCDGQWHTLAEITKRTGFPEASVSCQLRDFRKLEFRHQTVVKRRKQNTNKKRIIYEYQLQTSL